MDDKKRNLEIVGVVKDFYYSGVDRKVQPVMFSIMNEIGLKTK